MREKIDRLYSRARDFAMDIWDSISEEEFSQIYRRVRPFTMCGNARLRGLHQAVHYIVAKNITGDLVECGTARGGSASLMALTLKRLDTARTLWVLDTFAGLPPPTIEDPDWEAARLFTGSCRATVAEVTTLFESLGVLGMCKLVEGRFQDTVRSLKTTSIALLHIDGDWYDSVKFSLEGLYDRITPGGVIQIDDYGHWKGARKAVDEFIRGRLLQISLKRLDYTGRQFIKPNGD
jgi:predicted O-methyltransferase YrrM